MKPGCPVQISFSCLWQQGVGRRRISEKGRRVFRGSVVPISSPAHDCPDSADVGDPAGYAETRPSDCEHSSLLQSIGDREGPPRLADYQIPAGVQSPMTSQDEVYGAIMPHGLD